MLAPAIAVFLEAPRSGVLSRIAAELGDRHAIRLYRVLAGRTLAAAAETGWRTTIWFAPAEAHGEMRRWLGEADLRPQASGDLGARIDAAAHTVELGRTWIALMPEGAAAGLTARTLREADAALAYGGLVLGPTRGGGLYLVGAQAPVPDVWRGLPWGTPGLFDALRARLAERKVPWRELATLPGTESVAAARAAGLLT